MLTDVKESIQEPIKVVASFAPNKFKVHFFNWRDRSYQVESMNLFHIEKNGNKRLYHFAVSSQGNSYELVYDPITLDWQLKDIVSA